MSERPLTDEDLLRMERGAVSDYDILRIVAEVRRLRAEAKPLMDEELAACDGINHVFVNGRHVPFARLAAEVRRLRSDEWLRAAADDLTRSYKGVARGQWHAEILAALRKHRDGKA